MKRRTSFKVLSAAFMCMALGSGSAYAQQKDKVTLMLNWYVTGPNLAFYVGKDKGYFDQENIDLQIQEGRGSGPTIQAVAGNNVTFGYADISTMIKIAAKGAPVKAVGVAVQTSPIAVIGLAEKNIRKPEDIKGKTVAMTAGDAPSQMWPVFLKKTGLKESDFKTVNGDSKTKVNAVINGQADVLIGFSTDQTNEIQLATKKPVHAVMFADQDINNVNLGIVAHKELIASNPDLVRRFMRAATKAFEETQKNPEAAVDITLKLNPKAGAREGLLNGLNATIPLLHTPDTAKDRPFRVSAKAMNDTMMLMTEYGGVDKSAGKAENFYTNEFLP
jgi:NitT/TauT family transport system substrate-binding protein